MLTERIIRDVESTGKARTIWDTKVRGLGLQVTPGGRKNFVIRYRVAGRKRQAIIARVGGVSLADIRKRAAAELVSIRAGETDPLQREEDARQAPMVAEGVDRFFAETAPERVRLGRMKPKTIHEYRLQSKIILRATGKRRVADVTRRDIERMVAPLKPVMRNRTLALTSRLWTEFRRWGWCDANPVQFVERAREEARDRVLSDTEIAGLAGALEAESKARPAAVAAIRVAAMTGLRIGEVIRMGWSNIDFESGRLTLPDSKTGRRVHPLSTAVLETLADIPRVEGCPYVFTTDGRVGITYRTVHQTFRRSAKRAGLEDVRLHDLRRTIATSAAADGIGAHAIRDLLGHRTMAMANRYVRNSGAVVRDATERMGSRMRAIMDGKPAADVVPLRG